MATTRRCLQCGKKFAILTRGDNHRLHCSEKCAKKRYAKQTKAWHEAHPKVMLKYNKARLIKNPGAWREKHREERKRLIAALGGKCVVCGVTNPNWLHMDYVPTTRHKPYRHPRHPGYVLKHLGEFRLLCANHHYELTLTGQIDGTEITQ